MHDDGKNDADDDSDDDDDDDDDDSDDDFHEIVEGFDLLSASHHQSQSISHMYPTAPSYQLSIIRR